MEQKMTKTSDEAEWVYCENCIDGFTDHDCGEDTCCCAEPEDNIVCEICHGNGGWYDQNLTPSKEGESTQKVVGSDASHP